MNRFEKFQDSINQNKIAHFISRVDGTNADGSHWTLSVGDRVRVEADEADDDSADEGRLSSFVDTSTAVVHWDSGCATEIEIERLTHEE